MNDAEARAYCREVEERNFRKFGVRPGSKADRILAETEKNPDATAKQIAERVGTKASYVEGVRWRYGAGRAKNELGHVNAEYSLENRRWLARECRRLGVRQWELVDALITDARLDDETGLNAAMTRV